MADHRQNSVRVNSHAAAVARAIADEARQRNDIEEAERFERIAAAAEARSRRAARPTPVA